MTEHPRTPGKAVDPPTGYRRIDHGSRRVYVHLDHENSVEKIGFLSGVPTTTPTSTIEGRAPHPIFETEELGRVIWKQCRRGGVVRHIFKDRFFRTERFLRELNTIRSARHAGVEVGEILATAFESGVAGTRVEQLILFEENTRDLATTLADRTLTFTERRNALGATASTLRRFHRAGLVHGDLNLKNILVSSSQVAVRAILIDLDPPPRLRRAAHSPEGNLLRLLRSWARLRQIQSMPLTAGDRAYFLHCYFGADTEAARRFWRHAAETAHRLNWFAARRRSRP